MPLALVDTGRAGRHGPTWRGTALSATSYGRAVAWPTTRRPGCLWPQRAGARRLAASFACPASCSASSGRA